METRRLGKTGHQSSVVTFGAYAIGHVPQAEADRAIEWALANGINHFDVAPSYADAELRLGDYLGRHPQPGLFISCKTEQRARAQADMELRRTLERLHRDRFDLYQLHAVCTMDDLDDCFAAGGSMEAILAARDEGLVGPIGITGHAMQAPAVHAAALRRFDFATVMTAVNPYLYNDAAFRRDWDALIALCRAQDAGVHVLKATAKAPWGDRQPTHNTWYEPLTGQEAIDQAVAWCLSQPVTTLCASGDLAIFAKTVEAAKRYRSLGPITAPEVLATVPDYGNIFAGAEA